MTDTLQTWIDMLLHRSHVSPERVAYTFLADGETDERRMTHLHLHLRASVIATRLMRLGIRPGARALLLYEPGLEYIAGFFGCLYAGVVAVPAYPPDPVRLPRTLPRVQAIVADARASVVLTTELIFSMADLMFEGAPDLGALNWLPTDSLSGEESNEWTPPDIDADALALLQYTSGSTGQPKGVMLSHGNLIANARAITDVFGIEQDSIGVSWLPPYHDMGLIGGIMQPLFVGRPTVLMSPLSFLRRPMRWLEAISRVQGSISGAPNFAFELCARKATDDDCAALDLSSWDVAFCGAEPVRQVTMRAFADRFRDCGFMPEAFFPCYGLAESTLLVTGGKHDAPTTVHGFSARDLEQGRATVASSNEDGRALIGCGWPAPDHEVLIVDAATKRPCDNGTIGEIWVRGPSVAAGYWQLDADTEHTFGATLDGDGRRFLRTGDLGFLFLGELFVTGRSKDMIVIRGRNYYPHDIETTVERAHPALRPSSGAAFSVEAGGKERLIIVHEIERRYRRDRRRKARQGGGDRRASYPDIDAFKPNRAAIDFPAISQAILEAVADEHHVQPFAVVLVRAGTVPKTSSGKIQRRQCRDKYVADELAALHDWSRRVTSISDLVPGSIAPEAPLAAYDSAAVAPWLSTRIGALLRLEAASLDPDTPLSRFGTDSLQAVELQNAIEQAFGVSLTAATLLRGPTINELAAEIDERRDSPRTPPIAATGRFEALPLSAAQERLWFLSRLDPSAPHYNVPAAISMQGVLRGAILTQALNEIVARHDSLRMTFSDDGGTPQAKIEPVLAVPLPMQDLSTLPRAQKLDGRDKLLAVEARKPFDIERGPLIRALLIRMAPEHHVLVVTLHHIISDGWSLGIFARELGEIYSALCTGGTPNLSPLPFQYGDYAIWERNERDADAFAPALAAWKRSLMGAPSVTELPTDRPRPEIQTFIGARHRHRITQDLSKALQELSKSEGVTLYQTLLSAFSIVMRRYTAQNDMVIGCVTANRVKPELDQLVGFFANTLPLRIGMHGDPTFRELMQRVAGVTVDAYAGSMVPFEKLVDAVSPVRDPSRNPLVQVVFVLQNSPMPRLKMHDLAAAAQELDTHGARFDLLVAVWETDDGLLATFEYAADLFQEATIARFAA